MNFEEIKKAENDHYLHTFNRADICFTHGVKNKLYDTEGREYIDFAAGIAVNLLGYGDAGLTEVISKQAEKLVHCSNLYYNEPQSALAEYLTLVQGFDRVFFGNSGAEANECAIKLARAFFYKQGLKNKTTVLCAANAFHGRTLATLAATGQEKYSAPFSPLPQGFKHLPFNDSEAFESALTDDVCAVMLEPIQGESGVTPAKGDFLEKVCSAAKSKGVLIIFDEIQTGMGRTGKFFAHEHYGVAPDIVTLSKGLAGGIPLGAALARGKVAEAFAPGDHGSTFGGGPLACASARYVVSKVSDPKFLKNVKDVGEYLKERLSSLKTFEFVGQVRGLGLMLGLPLDGRLSVSEVVARLRGEGVIVASAGQNTLRFIPPLTIMREEIDFAAEKLGKVFANYKV